MDTTEHDVRLLSVGYFIQGGIVSAYSLLALCYVGFFAAIFKSVQDRAMAEGKDIPPAVLSLIFGIVAFVVAAMVAGGLCLLYCGLALRRYRHRTFVLVMAALSCLAIPYGTVLGIFTFMVLQRPAARAIFGQPQAPPPLPPTI